MAADNVDAVPGVKDKDLAAVTRELVNAPDFKAASTDRFFSQLLAIAEKRAQAQWVNAGDADLAVFVLSSYPRSDAKGFQAARVADLIATNEQIFGRVFFLNGDASQGLAAALPMSGPGDVLEWLSSQPFAASPVVFLYRGSALLIERAKGASGEATRKENVRDTPPAATQQELLDCLVRFHEREIITPTICPEGVWKNSCAAKYHPGDDPERSIQKKLRTFLNGWFKGALHAECEDTTPIGRIDVRLLTPGAGVGLSYWAVIELKVVKSFRYSDQDDPAKVGTTENAEAIAEGLRQSHAFCLSRHCPPGYLEVFDMRKEKLENLLGHQVVVDQMALLQPLPVMHVRPIFGSASDARKAGYTLAA